MKTPITLEDPRLVAYALDELSDAGDLAAVELAVSASPELRGYVNYIRERRRMLRLDFSKETDDAVPVRPKRSFWRYLATLGIAAGLLAIVFVRDTKEPPSSHSVSESVPDTEALVDDLNFLRVERERARVAACAEDYLRAIQTHDWLTAVQLVDVASLARLKAFQKRYLQKAPTLADEAVLLRALGLQELSDIDALSPKEVFLRRGQAKTDRLQNAEHLGQVKESFTATNLGVVNEGEDRRHVVVRKEFQSAGKAYSELAFVSVTRDGMAWKVSLDAQEPTVRPLATIPGSD